MDNQGFKDFLISKNIEFKEFNNEDILVRDTDLIPYFWDIKEKFPDFEFIWEYKRYYNEPNGVSG